MAGVERISGGRENKAGGGGVLGNWAEEGGTSCIVFLSSSLSLGSSYDIKTATAKMT